MTDKERNCGHILCGILNASGDKEDWVCGVLNEMTSEIDEMNRQTKPENVLDNTFDWKSYEAMIKGRIDYHKMLVDTLFNMIGKEQGVAGTIMLHLENKVFLESLLKVGQKSLQGQARNDSTTNWNPFSNFKPY